jgi:hypothetical protein
MKAASAARAELRGGSDVASCKTHGRQRDVMVDEWEGWWLGITVRCILFVIE